MFWLLISLAWWYEIFAIPTPDLELWKCPEIAQQPIVECSCDMPHTLRCTGDRTAMQIIGNVFKYLSMESFVYVLKKF